LGERWTERLLENAGFRAIQDLNATRHNHPGGDFLAERDCTCYFITVKARNKFVQGGRRLNGGYNIYPKKVRAAAREYRAIPSWLTIQLDTDRRCFTAYFGTIDALPNPEAVAVPMSLKAVARYECLARDSVDLEITSDLSNQIASIGTAISAPSVTHANNVVRQGKLTLRRGNAPKRRGATMVSFEDHLAYTEE
jgi:hypothetical protein